MIGSSDSTYSFPTLWKSKSAIIKTMCIIQVEHCKIFDYCTMLYLKFPLEACSETEQNATIRLTTGT